MRFLLEKRTFNYVYYLVFILCTTMYTFGGFSLIHKASPDDIAIPHSFLFYSFHQVLCEVGILWIICFFLRNIGPKWLYFLSVTFSFAILLVHLTNFIMLRLLDSTLSYLLKFFAGHGISHVISVFQAINMNEKMMTFIILFIVSIPLCAIGFYKLTGYISEKRPYRISLLQVCILTLSSGICLFAFEVRNIQSLAFESHSKYQKTLPLGFTFFSPQMPEIQLSQAIAKPRDSKEMTKQFSQLEAISKPNIYLFIVETFRKDFINEEVAPNLSRFASENIHFAHSFANANSTQHSWFSIFHSTFPYHWTQLQKTLKEGSLSLRILQNLGYKIRVYSSADLGYFDMDKMIFNSHRSLADSIHEFASDRSLQSWERDVKVMDCFEKDLDSSDGKEGNVFLFFFDATHSEYSFPEEGTPRFSPIVKQIDYLSLDLKNLEPIKNRYRNAIYFIDSLFQRFFTKLIQKNIYENSIIAITGDHGEEFFEEGSLFHGTHLNHAQTCVPIFLKFPDSPLSANTNTATHVDIFPSILHWLTKINCVDLFDGESIFLEKRWPYRLCVLQNGAETPREFLIEKEGFSLRARFMHPEDLYNQKSLQLLSLKIQEDWQTMDGEKIVKETYPDALQRF